MNNAGSNRALTLGTMAFALSFMVWGLVSPLAPTLQKLYSLTNTQVSLLIAIPVLLGAIGRLPMGVITDQHGGRKVFTIMTALMLLPLGLMGFVNSYGGLVSVAFLLGIAGTAFSVGVPFVSRWFPPQKQGLALGVYGAGNIGQAGAALVAPRVAEAYGWQAAFTLMMVPVAVFAVVFWLMARDAEVKAPRLSFWQNLKAVQGDSMTWLLAFFYFITFGGFVAFSNYIPKLYVDLFGMSKAAAGSYAALFVLLATAMRPVGGWLADKVGGARILPWLFAVATVLAVKLVTVSQLHVFHPTILIIGLLFGLGNGVTFKLVPQFFPRQTGTVTGIVGAMGGLGGFFPPLIMGMFKDSFGSYDGGFLLLALFAVVALAGAVLLAFGRWPVSKIIVPPPPAPAGD